MICGSYDVTRADALTKDCIGAAISAEVDTDGIREAEAEMQVRSLLAAGADTTVAGVKIEEGTKVLCVLGAASRDPAHWDQPDRFVIFRKTAGHLALGVGVHTCVGQNIAQAEGQAVLHALAERLNRNDLAGDPIWKPKNGIHALDQLSLRLIPA